MKLNKEFHVAKFWGVTHRVYVGINKKPLKIYRKTVLWPNLDHFLILQ